MQPDRKRIHEIRANGVYIVQPTYCVTYPEGMRRGYALVKADNPNHAKALLYTELAKSTLYRQYNPGPLNEKNGLKTYEVPPLAENQVLFITLNMIDGD